MRGRIFFKTEPGLPSFCVDSDSPHDCWMASAIPNMLFSYNIRWKNRREGQLLLMQIFPPYLPSFPFIGEDSFYQKLSPKTFPLYLIG